MPLNNKLNDNEFDEMKNTDFSTQEKKEKAMGKNQSNSTYSETYNTIVTILS